MPLPLSRSALDRLGKRLAAETVSAADWGTFETVLDAYQATLDDAQGILESAGFEPTTRVKSTGTLVEKLSRGTSFKSVQDVAGARVVVNRGRVDQDRAVARIARARFVIRVTEQGVTPPLDETEDTLRRTMNETMNLVRTLEGG